MMLQWMVVCTLVPALALGAGRGEKCVNRWSESATCTNIHSCKAAIDALSNANGTEIYGAGRICGYDTEPLVCCKTVADALRSTNNVTSAEKGAVSSTTELFSNVDLSSADLDIFTNVSALNNFYTAPFLLAAVNISNDTKMNGDSNVNIAESSTASADIRLLLSINSTTMVADANIFTSPPLVIQTSETPTLFSVSLNATGNSGTDISNRLIPSETSDLPDVLPLQSNGTSSQSSTELDLSRFPVDSSQLDFPSSILNRSTETSLTSSTEDFPSSLNPSTETPLTSSTEDFPSSLNPSTETSLTSSTEGSSIPFFATLPPISRTTPLTVSINKLSPDINTCGFQKQRRRLPDAPISSIDEFPWVALLKYQYGNSFDAGFRCVGTLINNRYVITAAQCVVTQPESFYLTGVRLGEWSRLSPKDCGFDNGAEECTDKPVDVAVDKKIPHPKYDPSWGSNNIALIRLERIVDFTVFIRPICLPAENLQEPPVGTSLITAGWGTAKFGAQLDIKSKIRIPVLPKEKCSNGFRRVFDDQMCVGIITKNDICMADTGGPLMAIDEETKVQWYLEGVISEGFKCGRHAFPGVYTRVTKNIEWILSTIGKDII